MDVGLFSNLYTVRFSNKEKCRIDIGIHKPRIFSHLLKPQIFYYGLWTTMSIRHFFSILEIEPIERKKTFYRVFFIIVLQLMTSTFFLIGHRSNRKNSTFLLLFSNGSISKKCRRRIDVGIHKPLFFHFSHLLKTQS